MLFLREQVCRSLTGPRLVPGSHAGFKLLDNFLGGDFVGARHLVRSRCDLLFSGPFRALKTTCFTGGGSGRGSRLSSPEAHFSGAQRGAEASTVGCTERSCTSGLYSGSGLRPILRRAKHVGVWLAGARSVLELILKCAFILSQERAFIAYLNNGVLWK